MTITTQNRTDVVREALQEARAIGITVNELEAAHPFYHGENSDHHGAWSGRLSTLHRAGEVSLLKATRGGCQVYVLPECVYGRETVEQGRPPTRLELFMAEWLEKPENGRWTKAQKNPGLFVRLLKEEWDYYVRHHLTKRAGVVRG